MLIFQMAVMPLLLFVCHGIISLVEGIISSIRFRVSVQGVESLWDDCRFIPADWGS